MVSRVIASAVDLAPRRQKFRNRAINWLFSRLRFGLGVTSGCLYYYTAVADYPRAARHTPYRAFRGLFEHPLVPECCTFQHTQVTPEFCSDKGGRGVADHGLRIVDRVTALATGHCRGRCKFISSREWIQRIVSPVGTVLKVTHYLVYTM